MHDENWKNENNQPKYTYVEQNTNFGIFCDYSQANGWEH